MLTNRLADPKRRVDRRNLLEFTRPFVNTQLMDFPAAVRIVEVGPRDGLQNESVAISSEDKITLIELLSASGLKNIESGSFVSPRWVPQMADTDAVFEGLSRDAGVTYSALTPNLRGFEAARAAGADEVAVFAAVSERFSQKNINCTIDESLQRLVPVIDAAIAAGIPVRGYLSCVLGCPYEGNVDNAVTLDLTTQLLEAGCYEVSLGDTIGTGTPASARELVELLTTKLPAEKLAVHFHDTYGQALANILAVMPLGVSVIDSAVAGLGGCPYAQGASGNVATEDVLYMLDGMGIKTGVDLARVLDANEFITGCLGRKSVSRTAQAMLAKRNP